MPFWWIWTKKGRENPLSLPSIGLLYIKMVF
jgi:hypothetical protein